MSSAKYTAIGLAATVALWLGSRELYRPGTDSLKASDSSVVVIDDDGIKPSPIDDKKKRKPLLPLRKPSSHNCSCPPGKCYCGQANGDSCGCGGHPDNTEEAVVYGAKVGGNVGPDGSPIQIDFPPSLQLKNVGGRDGAGLCVFTSITHAARWQNLDVLQDFQQWMRQYNGGGWPGKVTQMIDKYCKEKNLPVPAYIQIEDRDLEILKLACRTGRMPSITYGVSPTGRYGGSHIAHMVSLLEATDKWFVVCDNNFPQTASNPNTLEWMSPQEFLRSYTSGGQTGWAVIFLGPVPPPAPHN